MHGRNKKKKTKRKTQTNKWVSGAMWQPGLPSGGIGFGIDCFLDISIKNYENFVGSGSTVLEKSDINWFMTSKEQHKISNVRFVYKLCHGFLGSAIWSF